MRKISDIFTSNLAMHQIEHRVAEEDLRYFIQHRDTVNEKIRFGLIALNGGSLIALLGIIGGGSKAATWLGFNSETSLASAVSFFLGLMLAATSITSHQNLATKETGDAVGRVHALRRILVIYDREAIPDNVKKFDALMDSYEALPLTGFQFSNLAISTQNFSGGAWAFGIALPLLTAVESPMLKFWQRIASAFCT